MVKTPPFNAGDGNSIPGQVIKVSHAKGSSKKLKNKNITWNQASSTTADTAEAMLQSLSAQCSWRGNAHTSQLPTSACLYLLPCPWASSGAQGLATPRSTRYRNIFLHHSWNVAGVISKHWRQREMAKDEGFSQVPAKFINITTWNIYSKEITKGVVKDLCARLLTTGLFIKMKYRYNLDING